VNRSATVKREKRARILIGCEPGSFREWSTSYFGKPAGHRQGRSPGRRVHNRTASLDSSTSSITKSPVLTVGTHHVEVTDATDSLTTVLRGRVNASKIEMTSHDRTKAIFLFLLDSADRITQANLTIVVPGSTVVRTIAWTPADLEKYFSNAHRSNGRLRLVSKGTYDSKDLANEALVMSWDVDVDVSVDERANPS
jgi:hypothetical protein